VRELKRGVVWLAVFALWGFAGGCNGDDNNGTPAVSGDVFDTPADVVAEDTAHPEEETGPVDYPPAPYGVLVDDRLENLRFIDTEGNPLDLADIYADRSVKLLWIYATAGWCSVCAIQSAAMNDIYATYNPQGLEILAVIFEDASGAPATASYARSYKTRYGWAFPAASDQPFVLGRYFDKAATPMNMLVDLTDMTIVSIEMGWSEASETSLIETNLAAIADRTP
jgi:peroxiredoxin